MLGLLLGTLRQLSFLVLPLSLDIFEIRILINIMNIMNADNGCKQIFCILDKIESLYDTLLIDRN